MSHCRSSNECSPFRSASWWFMNLSNVNSSIVLKTKMQHTCNVMMILIVKDILMTNDDAWRFTWWNCLFSMYWFCLCYIITREINKFDDSLLYSQVCVFVCVSESHFNWFDLKQFICFGNFYIIGFYFHFVTGSGQPLS